MHKLFILALIFVVQGYTTLSDAGLRALSDLPRDISAQSPLLSPILIPRVPGSEGSHKALQHFDAFFRSNLTDWDIAYDNFTATTPKGEYNFSNFIATRDPPWITETTTGDVGRLTLVAHYDSLSTPEGFIGAIDSAAPCAVLMYVAQALEEAFSTKWASGGDESDYTQGLQILFLDGEEAFQSWSRTDSIYGARHLAQHWESDFYPAFSTRRTKLAAIDMFVLLDLLGSEDPKIPSYYPTTHWAYSHLRQIESRLRAAKLTEVDDQTWFFEEQGSFHHGWIEDDHMPFVARGVEILHVIPASFPSVWHKITDDGDHLHAPTTNDWGLIFAAFVAEWLDLNETLNP